MANYEECEVKPCRNKAVGKMKLSNGEEWNMCPMHKYVFDIVGEKKFKEKFIDYNFKVVNARSSA